MRRLLRIAPLYLLVLTLHWFVSSRFSALVFGLMDADSLVEHLLLQRGDGVYWAVPVEMKYYLLLPLASFGLALVRGRALVLATIGTGALVAWLAPAASLAHNSTALLPYLPVLLAGSFAASLQREIERRGASETVRARLGFEAIAALCAIVAIVLVPSVWAALAGTDLDPNRFHGETLLWGGLWGVFVIAMLNGSGWTRAALSHPALRLIGIVSFSVYLWHMPIIRALFLLLPGMPQPVFAAVAVALVLLASAISFVLIERPFIRSRAAIRLLARLG
jgi:peptidoglycan/LPS O-acetylase OafA/YrhL